MEEITRLLDQVRTGDRPARERFFKQIYADLDLLARRRLGRNSPLTLLDAPGLVHESWLRLERQAEFPGQDRRTFLAYASRVMHSVVIDYVRARKAERNGAGQRPLTLNTGVDGQVFTEPQIEQLGDALDSLARIDERAHWVVEMRFFGGMEIEEIATVLDISPATVKRDWQKARAFLLHEIRSGAGES